jgi:hypothetical protein
MRPAKSLFILYAFVFGFLRTARAQACSCAAPATTTEALKRATAVFRGKIIKISVPSLDWIGLTRTGAHRVKFEVLKQWKGSPAETSVVVTRLTGETCGFPFEEQKEYLVYIVAEPKQIQTGICTGTKSIADAEQEMEQLKELVAEPKRE